MRLLLFLWLNMISQTLMAAAVLSVEEIAAGVYVHIGPHLIPDTKNHGSIANIGFIVGDRCVAVIDTGGNPEQGLALKKAIAHVTEKPICYVINTHVHPDHIYGNKAFKQAGVQFVGHAKLKASIAARGVYYLEKAEEQLAIQLSAEDLVMPDIAVAIDTPSHLDLGGRTLLLTAHQTAHTETDLSVFDAKTNTLWLSDLLFLEHIPVIDGSLSGWLAELNTLEKQHYQFVVPGHGPVRSDWPNAMQAQKRYLLAVRDGIKTVLKQGKFMEDAMVSVAYEEKQHWQLFEQFHRKNISTAFAELEWEE